MSLIPSSILWPSIITDEPTFERWIEKMNDIYRDIRDVVNGKIELTRKETGGTVVTQNMGYPLDGTSDPVAGTSLSIPHSLGRRPSFFWIMPEHALGAAVSFYWTAADYAAWTENTVSIRCTAASIGYRGWVI